MKKKEFGIKLSYPCQQDWDNMPQVSGGLYCKDCCKVVIDFTVLSDAEIINILHAKSKGEICGKFHKSQLEKTYVLEEERQIRSYSALKLLLAGILTLKLPVDAQTSAGSREIPVAQGQKKKTNSTPDVVKSIKGKVSNKTTGAGISVTVSLYYGTTISTNDLFSKTVADSSGNYELQLPGSGLHKFFKLVFTHDDYEERSVVVDKDKVPHFLPVKLVPLVFVEIVDFQANNEAVILIDRVYTHGGIPVSYETELSGGGLSLKYQVKRRSILFWSRIKNALRKLSE